ncbi:hypothetical protein BegalDRAFT_3495 [Beggiatoa alba B18LD]|uniref:STAS domain-containing protein n=1 Tax=Beggiatoa alba B18LD TaxID=395493 RepID=I3CL12_9GAMM|nr:hypothetical protein [Beggiatoa alba]EIJ44305.1 hypothetical protein BegalDRAFT_3495 [Beggiatoa alba B18LD]
MNTIKDDKYMVVYQPEQANIIFSGSFMLNGTSAYEPILELMKTAAEEQTINPLTIDIRQLQFINSSGINMMTKFVMYITEVKQLKTEVILLITQTTTWQRKLSINLQRLMPSLQEKLA